MKFILQEREIEVEMGDDYILDLKSKLADFFPI